MEKIGTKRRQPLSDDDDDDSRRPPEQRKVRFPKGKKVKEAAVFTPKGDEEDSLIKPAKSAELRAKRRKKNRAEEVAEEEVQVQVDISKAEIRYEEDFNFVDDGIQIEPFNLNKEREEGYFDENGNFVEYAKGNEIKDAWLDSAEVDTKFAAKLKEKAKDEEEEFQDLSSDDVGKIKRNIANILQPGETIIQALKRLKGTTDNKTKMSEETKELFDRLTESAMKLMENGEYNVYHEEKETFEREAEGYERLARARGGASGSSTEDIFAGDGDGEQNRSSIWDMGPSPSASNVSAIPASSVDDDGEFDMFGDDDDNTDPSKAQTENTEVPTDSDYVYDPSSGYYYSSSLGYYFDSASGLYCCASTGIWYSFDEQTGTYEEVKAGTAPSGES
ncbi:CD2 antigen cytoplasmic tail-binding protein 2 [Rhynchospora pubera]|uniref:CD2 antigen cytoplasmic tail-binding protein 2 n=1 Tax=Rhynchospora pubera TaxID=906938 RepID=A0AAV8BRJ1_9POAL|nr:CD2 antigen cytoplasmic tail-binding protein 2 [Rhynchospora pubera]